MIKYLDNRLSLSGREELRLFTSLSWFSVHVSI